MSDTLHNLQQSLKKGYIDRSAVGSSLDPKLIVNNEEDKEFLLNVIQNELATAKTFFFSVAFITPSGLDALKTQLADLAKKGVSGKLITSTYLAFNHPNTFKDLLKIPNLEVRLSRKEGFHAKGYVFDQGDYQSMIVGSSNLTLRALKLNYEWNVRLTSLDHGEIIYQTLNHLQDEWAESDALSETWIDNYQKTYVPPFTKEVESPSADYILPNNMQRGALDSLKALRESGEKKGIVISATGTGKTYLAAFDVLNVKPKRMLFIVHREQIIDDAIASFKRILGGEESDYGKLTGSHKDYKAKYLFATNYSVASDNNLRFLKKNDFDYIIIDEAHRSGANTYLKAIDYFEPDFLLGITATPERTDDFNIFELFDYNVAYEIRLQDALAEDMLSPFHYFGVTDYEKDGVIIEEKSDLQHLVADERVDFLLEKIDYYGSTRDQIAGLIFCSRVDEAEQMSEKFNERGLRTTYLSGSDSVENRKEQVEKLENGELQYIFTVDIFNEGIDIPKINQIIMLRSTQSSIIFTQQMGRGLRKHPSKEYVTIIDFIGNYDNNYLIPTALIGDGASSKDSMRRNVVETSYISGLSAINFEEIAKEKIFASIDTAKVDAMKTLKKGYVKQKERINRIPKLMDFAESDILDPIVVAAKYNNYYNFLKRIKEINFDISKEDNNLLYFMTSQILPGLRIQEINLINYLIETHATILFNEEDEIAKSVINTLTLNFYNTQWQKIFTGGEIIQRTEKGVKLSDNFETALNNKHVAPFIYDILETGTYLNEKYDNDVPFTRYQKYYRRDTMRLLHFDKQMVDQNVGGYVYDNERKNFIIFVTLDKGENFKGSEVHYEDDILDRSTMRWFTKAPRTLESPEVKIMQDSGEWTIHMFLKKSDDEGKDFYYLGEMKPVVESIQQLERPTSTGKQRKVVEMNLKFNEPLSIDIYDYLK